MNTPVVIRDAVEDDGPAICELCLRINPEDYVPRAWADWIANEHNVNLVAESGGRVVGYLFGGRVSPTEAFSQALRVDVGSRRQRIGYRLMMKQHRQLREHGVTIVRGAVDMDNRRSRPLFKAVGMKELRGVIRRRHRRWRGDTNGIVRPSFARLQKLAYSHRILASRPALAVCRRSYRSPDNAWLERVADEGLAIASGDSVAILDPPTPGRLWVAALDGPVEMSVLLLRSLASASVDEPVDLEVDSPADPIFQARLDDLGFEPPDPNDRFIVVEGATDYADDDL